MFRKITLIAIPAMALIVALSTSNSASQAFAKGGSMGKGGHGMSKFHRGHDWKFRNFRRYGWDYGYGFACIEPVIAVPVVAPVCPKVEVAPVPVVAPAPVAPVCTACAPVVSVVTPEYIPYFGYGKYRRFEHRREHREHPLNHGGSRGGRK